ncbi:hypothetical protein ACFSHT_13265 [Paraburkholderia silviterrae]|uniref:Uncharacterized protein n=1 Tax=Paraburkholderia silviterrae TaxID=2528715 RepID=A0A4R5MB96_9BURK|nr:hypothetical protein [Paraburkholderia silviterrae]TDG23757.1 hypothetical protein EYW47_13620 [Paraburkholderia silviterrae]
MDMGVRLALARAFDKRRFALKPPFETHSTCFGSWLLYKRQACRRFQEKRPFAALFVRRAGAVPEPASRLLRENCEENV